VQNIREEQRTQRSCGVNQEVRQSKHVTANHS
jgi:hypothetical protein